MPNAYNGRDGHRRWWWALGLALAVLLVWGLEQVVVTPLETGEVYPPYSTLRSDPVGARALYESLAELPALETERLYKARTVLDAKTVLFVLGVEPSGWSSIEQKTLTEYENLLAGGGRLVIAFLPVNAPTRPLVARVVEDRWHVALAYRKAPGEGISEGSMPRHSALYFKPGGEWRTLSEKDGAPVAVERNLGGGAVVLVADSYPLSNEGLRDARDADLIAKLAGPARHILFDENHFGVIETGSVAQLMEKYHLLDAAAMLALAAALFLWRSASSFLPPREVPPESAVAGRDSLEGLAALLRRSVTEQELLDACYAEWVRTPGSARVGRDRHAREIEDEITRAGKRDPVERYRAVCEILNASPRSRTKALTARGATSGGAIHTRDRGQH